MKWFTWDKNIPPIRYEKNSDKDSSSCVNAREGETDGSDKSHAEEELL